MKLLSPMQHHEYRGSPFYHFVSSGEIAGFVDCRSETSQQPAASRDGVAMQDSPCDRPLNRFDGIESAQRRGIGKAMRNTSTWIIVPTLIALFTPHPAVALELGDITLNSYLYQPLDAGISVLSADVGELNDLHISVAPQNNYEAAGIDRSAMPDNIKFTLIKGTDGKPVIKLVSTDAVKEPVIDFILDVSSSKSHVMREYTVLLDPPATAEKAASQTENTIASTAGKKTTVGLATPEPERPSAAATLTLARSIEPRLKHDGYGPTTRSNTLWSIAKALRRDTSVSIPQMMLAIVKKNPEAFLNNNVNGLKAGYILRIPDKSAINQVSDVDALQQVYQERQGWTQSKNVQAPVTSKPQKPSLGDAQARAAPETTSAAAPVPHDNRVVSHPTATKATAATSDL
jgi:pilus assembly protein FimV